MKFFLKVNFIVFIIHLLLTLIIPHVDCAKLMVEEGKLDNRIELCDVTNFIPDMFGYPVAFLYTTPIEITLSI
jgi:hypothetical protein